MDDRLCFVRFLHPGYEHDVREPGIFPWNLKGKHRRKFLRSPGTYLDSSRRAVVEDLVFWGEWEPQSHAEPLHKPEPLGPRWLHTPFYEPIDGWGQNTDPFVFGEYFRFSICQQHRGGTRPTQLAKLLPGSVVLFGSGLGDDFRLDTVFVIGGGAVEHSRRDRPDVDPQYEEIVLKPYYAGHPDDRVHRLYAGATPDAPVNGMFSFFPCKSLSEAPNGFARPTIHMPEITPTHKQSYRLTFPRSLDATTELWREVVRQVEAQGLHLGVHADVPERRDVSTIREPLAAGSC
jgi:hypothetical protein